MREQELVDIWLNSLLTNDDTLQGLFGGTVRAYADLAPDGARMPFVTWNSQSDLPINTEDGTRVMVRHRYQVKAIDQGSSPARIAPILARLDDLLTKATAELEQGLIMSCIQVDQVRYTETTDGHRYIHAGGIYEIQSRATAGI